MKLNIKSGSLYLETEYTTGNKQWCARITGLHPKWKYEREFFNKERSGLKIHQVQPGDILEEVRFSHSGKNRDTDFYEVQENGELKEITEKDVIYKFQAD